MGLRKLLQCSLNTQAVLSTTERRQAESTRFSPSSLVSRRPGRADRILDLIGFGGGVPSNT